jgi:(2Fe-2S) ferredoxin
MNLYSKHIFFCTNQRDEGKVCCASSSSTHFYNYAKEKIRFLKKDELIRVSQTGCLGQCIKGPVLVIYPEATWYAYKTEADLDEIIYLDVFHNIKIHRLLLK